MYNLNADETITLKAKTPIFKSPLKRVIKVTRKKETFKVLGRFTEKSNKFPLVKCLYFYKIGCEQTPDKIAYAAPDLTVKMSKRLVNGRRRATIDLRSKINWTLMISCCICAFSFFFFLYFYCFKKTKKLSLSIIAFTIFLFFLRWIILSSTQTYPIRIFCSPTDENYYFQGALYILNLNFSTPMNVSVGTPLYYLPFCLLFGQENIYPVVMQISKFNGYILMPSITVMLFYISLKITRSYKKSIIFILLFSILPIFYHYFECWDLLLFKSSFGFVSFDGYRFYKQYISLGFNNLPDVPSTFIIATFILYALYGKKNIFYIILISILFAFSCLIRLNNILFAPVVAMIFWFKFQTDYQEKFSLLMKHVFISIICFFAIFSIQLYLNYSCYGSILQTGYGNNDPNAIFSIAFMKTGIKSVIGCNYIFMIMGCCGIIFQTDRRKRILFAIWSVPMMVFFCGTHAASVTPYRYFIAIFPVLFIAFFSLPIWQNLSKRGLIFVCSSIVLSFMLVSPSGMAPFTGNLPLDLLLVKDGKTIAIFLYCIAVLFNLASLFMIRRNRKVFVFLTFLLLLFFIGNQFLVFATFLAIFVWAVIDICRELQPALKTFLLERA